MKKGRRRRAVEGGDSQTAMFSRGFSMLEGLGFVVTYRWLAAAMAEGRYLTLRRGR